MPRPRLSLRSPLSILLLLLLRESPAPSHYISFYLGEDPRKVSTYLSRLRQYGLVDRDEYGIWFLTPHGHEYISRMEDALQNIGKSFGKLVQHLSKILDLQQKSAEIQQKSAETQQKSALRTVLEKAEQLLGRRLSPIEEALISYLYEFSRKTGRKYWWPPEPVPLDLALAEELRRSSSIYTSSGEVMEALRELESRGVIYITRDTRRGVSKIRLSRTLTG